MENNIYLVLQGVGLKKNEVQELVKANEGLEADITVVVQNLNLLITYGYPEEDLADLIRVNPAFMLNSPAFLQQKLIAFGENVEDILKTNPFEI